MKRKLLIGFIALLGWQMAAAQEAPRVWTLRECLDYALENNIQLQQSRNEMRSGVEDTKEAQAALFPSLTASTSQGYTNYPSSQATDRNSYTGTYGVEAGMTLYNGGKLRTAVKRQQVQNRIDELSVEETANDIRIAIVEAYMQCLYAMESVTVNRSTAEASKAQRDRAEQMWHAGSISKVDFAQFESQYASDRYQVVVALSSLDNYKLRLKQLLELDITDQIELVAPTVGEQAFLTQLPEKTEVYETALGAMPEIARGELSVEAAELEIREAKSGFLPSLSLTAGIGTGHMSGGSYESGSQIWNRFNENVGLTLSIPIFSNRKNRTAVNKARLAAENSRLTWLDLKKTLLEEVEGAYLDAVSAQSQYVAAAEKESYAQQSYELTSEQFAVGMKNTVEVITAQNELTAARQEVLPGQIHGPAEHRVAEHLSGSRNGSQLLKNAIDDETEKGAYHGGGRGGGWRGMAAAAHAEAGRDHARDGHDEPHHDPELGHGHRYGGAGHGGGCRYAGVGHHRQALRGLQRRGARRTADRRDGQGDAPGRTGTIGS